MEEAVTNTVENVMEVAEGEKLENDDVFPNHAVIAKRLAERQADRRRFLLTSLDTLPTVSTIHWFSRSIDSFGIDDRRANNLLHSFGGGKACTACYGCHVHVAVPV